jgi:hypothetical protein
MTEARHQLTYYSFTNQASVVKPRIIMGLSKAANIVKVLIWKYPWASDFLIKFFIQ